MVDRAVADRFEDGVGVGIGVLALYRYLTIRTILRATQCDYTILTVLDH
jgi:hypothetical protein